MTQLVNLTAPSEQRQTTQKLRLDLIQLLIANGADVNTKYKDGKTVFDAASNGSPAQVWGNVLIPANGKMSLKISGDVLQATHTTNAREKRILDTHSKH